MPIVSLRLLLLLLLRLSLSPLLCVSSIYLVLFRFFSHLMCVVYTYGRLEKEKRALDLYIYMFVSIIRRPGEREREDRRERKNKTKYNNTACPVLLFFPFYFVFAMCSLLRRIPILFGRRFPFLCLCQRERFCHRQKK